MELAASVCEALAVPCTFAPVNHSDYGGGRPWLALKPGHRPGRTAAVDAAGEWMGMIRQIVDGEFDTSLPVFTPTAERSKARLGVKEGWLRKGDIVGGRVFLPSVHGQEPPRDALSGPGNLPNGRRHLRLLPARLVPPRRRPHRHRFFTLPCFPAHLALGQGSCSRPCAWAGRGGRAGAGRSPSRERWTPSPSSRPRTCRRSSEDLNCRPRGWAPHAGSRLNTASYVLLASWVSLALAPSHREQIGLEGLACIVITGMYASAIVATALDYSMELPFRNIATLARSLLHQSQLWNKLTPLQLHQEAALPACGQQPRHVLLRIRLRLAETFALHAVGIS